MKSFLPLLGALVCFTGCMDYDGSFRANEKLKFKHSTVFGNTKTKTLRPGRYNTSFEVTSGGKLKFTFRGEDTVEVKVDIPDHIELPTQDGSFFYMAEETGQNYDIQGNLNSEYTSSGIHSGVESCSYTTVERQCRRVCTETPAPRPTRRDPAPRPTRPTRPTRPVPPRVSCRNVCNNVSVIRYGNQNVRYRINYTKKVLDLTMNKRNGGAQVANYRGLEQSSSKSYTYRGRCL
tara:strand:+ start:578 stop:1279 length:702 start_codon:yes stop_codon:yes gene_type:complete